MSSDDAVDHGLVLSLRREARLRNTTVERLINDLLSTVVSDKLVVAILDN
jgi:hypothetical protein